MTSPHEPIAPSAGFRGRSGISPYVDFVIETDHRIGQVMEAVDRCGIAGNTLVILAADNGTALRFPETDGSIEKGIHFNTHMRGGKSDIWEGGHKVPFVIRWPGTVAAGSRNATPVCLTDITATIAELVGFDLPDNAAEDSISLWPALLGKPFSRGPIVNHSIDGKFAIRNGDWKLAFCPGSGGWSMPNDAKAEERKLPPLQLYDLSKDPLEETNLIERYPETVQRLQQQLRDIIINGRSNEGPPLGNAGRTSAPGNQ